MQLAPTVAWRCRSQSIPVSRGRMGRDTQGMTKPNMNEAECHDSASRKRNVLRDDSIAKAYHKDR